MADMIGDLSGSNEIGDWGKTERENRLAQIPSRLIEEELRRRQLAWQHQLHPRPSDTAWNRAQRRFQLNAAAYQARQEYLARMEQTEQDEFMKWLLARLSGRQRV
jgi:hypothetical protein